MVKFAVANFSIERGEGGRNPLLKHSPKNARLAQSAQLDNQIGKRKQFLHDLVIVSQHGTSVIKIFQIVALKIFY